jgi:hypothetical protein
MICLVSSTHTPRRSYLDGSGKSLHGVSLVQSPVRLHSARRPGKTNRVHANYGGRWGNGGLVMKFIGFFQKIGGTETQLLEYCSPLLDPEKIPV